MEKKHSGGRPSIFGPKNVRAGGCRLVKGYLGKGASKRFSEAASRLSKLSGQAAATLSDADVIEYLVRGDDDTKVRLKRLK